MKLGVSNWPTINGKCSANIERKPRIAVVGGIIRRNQVSEMTTRPAPTRGKGSQEKDNHYHSSNQGKNAEKPHTRTENPTTSRKQF